MVAFFILIPLNDENIHQLKTKNISFPVYFFNPNNMQTESNIIAIELHIVCVPFPCPFPCPNLVCTNCEITVHSVLKLKFDAML